MKILLVHNYYQLRGGEDKVFEMERNLLEEAGHTVETFTVNNEQINSVFSRIFTFFNSIFSLPAYIKLKKYLKVSRPDVVHVHNYFPLLSPSVFYACSALKIPVVHTLHNYRAVCPTAMLMSKGEINELSIKGNSFWALRKRVYRDSFFGTLALVLMIDIHKLLGTWRKRVSGYIALTEFARDKFIEAGWPEDILFVKPNFVSKKKALHENLNGNKDYAVYVGRLSAEKGIEFLLSAWKNIDYPLMIIGDGPLLQNVKSSNCNNIIYAGFKSESEVDELIGSSKFLVMASTWYEGLPLVLIEAMANGKASLVPNIGGMQSVVKDGKTGLHFVSKNEEDFVNKATLLFEDKALLEEFSSNAFKEYSSKYTSEISLQALERIYSIVMREEK